MRDQQSPSEKTMKFWKRKCGLEMIVSPGLFERREREKNGELNQNSLTSILF